ncbi:hypothetical protein EDB80DRAFT_756774 [Ilyonectria destructans]|nr:hypothetical protein EDB80DRAFT_756774 [Ilyonectria destructans]
MSSPTSTSNSTLSGHPPPRIPYNSQKNLGSNITISFFGQLDTPTQFPTSDKQLIKSLNIKALSRVFLPPPPYITLPEYSILHPEGKIHPYTLDINPRTLYNSEGFPLIQPVISLTGQVLGTGQTHLIKDSIPLLDDAQLRYCAFIQCCTYITPGQPSKSPFKGFHPFQVFILFPIRALPFSLLCKKIADRKDTQFIPDIPFNCIGKIVSLLDHSLIVAAPTVNKKDYIFIIVPNS